MASVSQPDEQKSHGSLWWVIWAQRPFPELMTLAWKIRWLAWTYLHSFS